MEIPRDDSLMRAIVQDRYGSPGALPMTGRRRHGSRSGAIATRLVPGPDSYDRLMTTRPDPQRDHWTRTCSTRSDFIPADGWELIEVAEDEVGKLPRRLFAVTMRRS